MSSKLSVLFKPFLLFIILASFQQTILAQHTIIHNTHKVNQIGFTSLLISNTPHSILQIDTSTQFTPILSKTINLLYQQQDCWIKFSLHAKDTLADEILSINYPLLQGVTVFFKKNSTPWDSSQINTYTLFQNRNVLSQNFAFSVPKLLPNDTLQVYLKVKSELTISLPIELNSRREYESNKHAENTVIAIYLGIMLSLFLYNLFVFIAVKDRNYLYYVIYVLFILLAQLGLSGFLINFILPTSQYNTLIIVLCSVFSGISAIKFGSKFLLLNTYAPRLNKGLVIFYVGYCVVLISFLSGQHLIAFKSLDLLGIGISIYALVFSIYVSNRGYRPAVFYLIAWSFFIASLIIFILRGYGVISATLFTNSSLQLGSAIEAILISFALADRINILKKEKELSQAEALAVAKENQRIIKNQNITLELKVTQRTQELNQSNEELSITLSNLKETQSQLVDSEKMASLGQLTAGIAHEINNPINFVTSNVKPLKRDVDILLELISKIEEIASTGIEAAEKEKQINELKTQYDFEYLKEEIEFLLKGINEGSTRTAEIVKGLRIFSRVDEDNLKKADINEGLDSTLIISNNQLNGRIVINKQYGNIPLVECYPGKLNQVFLNLISNAIYAINAQFGTLQGGEITICTAAKEDTLLITISDNGIGMPSGTIKKLFEPFFTTKPVGEGTGLGLSISYNTIKKHNGTITVNSELHKGTSFIIEIPIIQPNS